MILVHKVTQNNINEKNNAVNCNVWHSIRAVIAVCLLLLLSSTGIAQRTLNEEEAKAFGSLAILYRGRVAPMDSYAHDFVRKLYGKSSYRDFNAVQVLAGWLFFPEEWQNEPIFKLRDRQLRQKIGVGKYASMRDLMGNADTYQLFFGGGGYDHDSKAVKEAAEKISLIRSLQSGEVLWIFPQGSQWFAPKDDLSTANPNDTMFIANIFSLLYEFVGEGNHNQTLEIVRKIGVFQTTRVDEGIINPVKIGREIRYNRVDVCSILFKVNLLAGLLALAYSLICLLGNVRKRFATVISLCVLGFSFLVLTLHLALRWYISGHIPMSNGYETMMFLSWTILLISLIGSHKSPLVSAGGLLISGLTLLVASFGFMNPHITPLMPVLSSPWMSIHVSLVMVSYALLTFMFFNSLIALILRLSRRKSPTIVDQLKSINQQLLYPAVAFLCVGIFTGAVWANVSWGRYWGWDPKEVWALITMLVYAFPLHERLLPCFRRPLIYHLFIVFAFSCVLMTYFGVNYLLGGMHSYR